MKALLLLVVLAASWRLTGLVRRYALRQGVLDVPNERSAHARPIPRGGGLAVAATSLGWVGWLAGAGSVETRPAVALIVGALVVTSIGWLDDRLGVASLPRLLIHLAAASGVVAAVGGMPVLGLGVLEIELGWLGSVLAAVSVTWVLNLYNFMDGTDGIAGAQAVTAAGLGAVLLLGAGIPGWGWVMGGLAAATAGFLPWNWQPAKIFLGDSGSGFLGFMFGSVAIILQTRHGIPAIVWVMLLGPFVVDATLTLIRRAVRGRPFDEAHQEHAYQRAVRSGWSHGAVAGVVAVTSVGLGGLALLAQRYPGALIPLAALGLGVNIALYAAVERRAPMGA